MGAFVGVLEKVKYEVLALVFGALLVLISFYQVKDITKLELVALVHPAYPLLVVGIGLIGVSMAPGVFTWRTSRGSAGTQVSIARSKDSVSTKIGQNSITVVLGRLETAAKDSSSSLIVLPANEYFDDQCINDPRSALGAFVQLRFPGRTSEFKEAIATKLSALPAEKALVSGTDRQGYGLGTAVYLDHPLRESVHLLVAAATTERPGEGLRGDLVSLFTIARKANREAMANRLTNVFLPLIGAGHGSIKPSRALLTHLLAWSEILYQNPGQKIAVNIVVFRASEASNPEVSLDQAAQLLRVAVSVCEPMARD
jgi:O-acetyl-ADP-ribose deacetylase (regulator of RNase III)